MLQFGLNNSPLGYKTTTTTWKMSAMINTTNGANFPTNGGGMLHHHHRHQEPDYQQSPAGYPSHSHQNHHQPSGTRHRSPTKMTVGGGAGAAAITAFPRCSCCPYGYHIDLDFINYCQSLGNVDPSPGQKLRRDRRKARQSMEIMLGFQQQIDTLQVLPKVGESSEVCTPTTKSVFDSVFELENEKSNANSHVRAAAPSTNEKRLASAFANNALADVVQDFEKTLERTRTKSTSAEPERTPERMEEEARRRRTFDSRTTTTRERFFSEYEQLHTKRGLVRDASRYDNVLDTSGVVPQTPVKDMDVESVKSSASSAGSEMSTSALQYIREQMATSLNKIRDLEEQNKLIPLLQKELQRLKEEKTDLERQQRATRSPFSPQRVSPIQLQSTADMMKPKLTMREIGIQNSVGQNTTGTATRRMDEDDVTEKLFTETEVRRLLEEAEAKRSVGEVKDSRSIGLQMDSPKEECVACLEHKEERQKLKMIVKVPRGSQTDFKVKTTSVGVTARPETRSVGSSDHSVSEATCDKCRTRKRTIACGPDVVESTDGGPISLKSLDRVTSKSKSDLTLSMEALMSTSQTSVSSIGTQMGNTTRDAGCQSVGVVLSNKSSQSDMVVVKGKGTDTNGLVEWLDQGCNTDKVDLEAEVEAKLKQTLIKPSKTKSTNTIGVTSHEQGTNTLAVRMNETAANTDQVSRRDVGVEVQTAVKETVISNASLPRHVSVGCDNVKDCDVCQEKIKELAKAYIKPQVIIPAPVLTPPKVTSPGADVSAGSTSRIPRPNMSPMVQRKATNGAVLKRQDTYTVDMAAEERQAEEEDRRVKEPTNEPRLTSPATDLIEEMGTASQEQRSKVIESAESKSIPTGDRPMSLVQELEESAPAAAEISKGVVSKLAKKLETQTTTPTTNVPKVSKTSESRPSISEDDLRKEFSNLPRKTARPSQGMMGALKVINDSLMKSMDGHSLLNANTIVRREWFQVSSSESADPLDVEDYLDCFEEFSSHLLRYMVNLTDANGNTAMHYAVSHGNFDIVSILLDSKVCNVNQMNNAGYTCVMLVSLVKLIESAHRHVVHKLFQMSDVNIKAKKHNQTALMLAVSHGNLDMVQALIEAGADINIQDEDGSTALMCAAEHGKIDIVKLLLAQPDCDSSIQDVDGSTSLKIALDAGYRDIGILLYAHDHMSRHRSPHSTLPRKSKLGGPGGSSTPLTRYSPSASAPASPAPSKKYFDHRK